MAGGVDRLLNIATKRLADGESKKVVEAQLYKQIAPLLAEIAQKPSAIALNDEGIAALQIQSKTSNPQDAIAKTIAHFNVDTDSDAGKGLQKAADVAGKHWGKTSSDIVRQYGILDKEAKKHGYSIQKALSKGSPGLLTNIEGHWENAEEKLKNNLKGIESQALKSGKAIELIFTQGFNGIDFIEKGFKISADRSQHHWAKTAIEILKQFDILAAAAAEKGYDIQRFISEGSPGTTQRIRLYWLKTTKAIVENLSELASTSSLAGTSIEKGLSSGLNNVEKAIEKTQNKLIAIETEHNQKPHVEKKQRKEKQQQLELLEISHIVDTANLEQLSANIQESLKQARKDIFNHGITKTPYPLKERVPLPENKLVNFVFKLNTKSQKLADFLMNPVANLSNNLGNIGKSLTAPVVNLSDNLGNIGESLVESFKKADTWIRSVGDRVMDLKSKARDFLSGSNSKEAEKNDTSAVEELARDLGKSIRQVYNSTGFILENLSVPDVIPRSLEAFAEGFLGIESAAGLAKKQLYAIATAGALVLFGKQIVDTLVHLAQFQMQIDGIGKKLRAVGEQPVTDIFDEFGEAANRAGARVTAFADSYAGMVASLKGRVANHKELVFDLAIGLSDRGVEGEAQDLTLKALQQMAGKGVVSMEELRQQVGDYLPNALGIAASAMGLTEKQMIALVGSGQLLASEFLPKLAKELQVTGEQQTSLTKEVVRFQNTLDEIKFDAASIIPFKQGMQLLNWALEKTEAIVKPLFVALGVAGAALLANLAVQAVIAAAKIQMVGQALMWTWKMLMPLLLSTAALFAIAKAWDLVMVGSANSARNLNKELQKLASEGLKDVKEELTGYKSDNPFVLTQKAKFREETVNRDAIASGLNSLIQLDFKFRARTDDAEIQRVSEDLASDIEKAKNMAYKIANRETFGISQKEALMMQQEVDKFNEGIDSRLNSSFNPSEMEAALKDIDTRRKLAERELEKGANVEQYASIMLELDIRENEIRKSLIEPPSVGDAGFPYRLLTRLSPLPERHYWAV